MSNNSAKSRPIPELTKLLPPKFAQAAGLDTGKFTTCLSSGKYAKRVQRDFEEGVTIGVKGTPYTVVWNRKSNKQMAINGAYPYDTVKTVLGLVTASTQNAGAETAN